MSPTSRRPGPRNDVDVPATLLDVAEAMFGTSTVGAVSLRAVAREAGVAPAAVGYHFASKRDLLAAVVRRRSVPMAQDTRERLLALVDPAATPTARALVDAILLPVVAVLDAAPVRGLHWTKIYVGLALAEDPLWTEDLGSDPSLSELFLDAAARVLPDISDAEVRRRTGIAMFSMYTALAGSDLAGYGHPLGPDGLDPRFVEQLAVFTTSGLVALSGDASRVDQ